MAQITAALVNELRAKTGQGMMECKKFLTEAGGDVEKAIDLFRKAGVKSKITERIASEGRVFGVKSADGKNAALVEILCNTDFTARSEPVAQLANKAAQALLANPSASAAALVAAQLTEVSQKTGENVQVGKAAVVSAPAGKAGLYIYAISSKIGVLLQFAGTVANVTDELVSDIGGHIAFAKPLALDRTGVSADLVAKEREIAIEQAKATGKPQAIAEKIAEGKLNAWFKEQTLLDQDFFNAGKFKGSVGQLIKEKGLTLEKYVRIEVGGA